MKNDEHDSNESIELDEEVEPYTLVILRFGWARIQPKSYSPLHFHSPFVLSGIDDDPKSTKEAVDLMEGEL